MGEAREDPSSGQWSGQAKRHSVEPWRQNRLRWRQAWKFHWGTLWACCRDMVTAFVVPLPVGKVNTINIALPTVCGLQRHHVINTVAGSTNLTRALGDILKYDRAMHRLASDGSQPGLHPAVHRAWASHRLPPPKPHRSRGSRGSSPHRTSDWASTWWRSAAFRRDQVLLYHFGIRRTCPVLREASCCTRWGHCTPSLPLPPPEHPLPKPGLSRHLRQADSSSNCGPHPFRLGGRLPPASSVPVVTTLWL